MTVWQDAWHGKSPEQGKRHGYKGKAMAGEIHDNQWHNRNLSQASISSNGASHWLYHQSVLLRGSRKGKPRREGQGQPGAGKPAQQPSPSSFSELPVRSLDHQATARTPVLHLSRLKAPNLRKKTWKTSEGELLKLTSQRGRERERERERDLNTDGIGTSIVPVPNLPICNLIWYKMNQ